MTQEGCRIAAGKTHAILNPCSGARLSFLSYGFESSEETNLLWNPLSQKGRIGDDTWRHGGIPILFPFAGNSFLGDKKGQYGIEHRSYTMPIHGLVHNSHWTLGHCDKSFANLSFESNSYTRKHYPWDFKLTARWELQGSHLFFSLTSKNLGCLENFVDQRMPIAAGLHPYFDRRMFSRAESSSTVFHEIDLFGRAGGQIETQNYWNLSEAIFHNTLIHNIEPASASAALIRDRQGHLWVSPSRSFAQTHETSLSGNATINIEGDHLTNAFVLWSDLSNNFYCLEPWMGFPDALQNAIGLKRIGLEESLTWTVKFTFK